MVDSFVGRQFANYRLDREIGRGGMAVVYAGWDLKLDRPVAIKLINSHYLEAPGYAQRFVQEARAVARWRHDNIIHIYYADDEEGLYYFVMEYIEGVDLRRRLIDYAAAHQLIPHAEVLRIGRAIANALDFAHSKGVVHRDVKPANVMLGNDGRVVLMDFGLALHVERGSFGEILGSPAYISPEQARSSAQAVPASDLYSLGVMLYEMLTGTLPFEDPAPATLALQHMTQPVPSPRQRNPLLNEATEQVLLKALAKEPTGRFTNGKTLMDALAAALQAPAGKDTLLGHQLDEFRITDYLGRGGMARVYRGVDISLGRTVAIKVIDTPFRTSDDYQARFKQEARAIAQLEHPNIVRLYSFREREGLLYMAMQFIEGGTLAALLNPHHLLRPERILELARDICAALDEAHRKGVIHRDVKPANVMVDQNGRAIVMDFGLALLTDLGSRGEIFGSPDYISPEQAISSAHVVPQSDLYAVGVILYQMFTGVLPFTANDPLDVTMMHLSEPPRPPDEVNPALSPLLSSVILKVLAKEPAQRYQTGAELVQALEKALQGESVAAALPPTPLPPHPSPTITPQDPVISAAESSAMPLDRPLPPPPAGTVGSKQLVVNSEPLAVNSQKSTVSKVEGRIAEKEAREPGGEKSKTRPQRRFWLYLVSTLLLGGIILVAFAFLLPPDSADDEIIAAASTATATVTLTPTTTPSITPSTTPTVTPQPTVTATTEAVLVPTTGPTQVPSFTPTPAPTLSPTPSHTPTPTPIVTLVREQDEMPMILIPGGSFTMGAAADDPDAQPDELPAHEVTLNSFYLDQYEVNVTQYAAFLNSLGGYVQRCDGFTCAWTLFESSFTYLAQNSDGTFLAEPGFEAYPVNYVSWYGAAAYCEWVGARLPTEAEWELAARSPAHYLYPWGNEPPSETLALYGGIDVRDLQPVTNYPDGVTPLQIYGLAGSMWEWTADWYDADYYTSSPSSNPTGPETVTTEGRVLRGGGWRNTPLELRATNRQPARPATFERDIGFRCGRDNR